MRIALYRKPARVTARNTRAEMQLARERAPGPLYVTDVAGKREVNQRALTDAALRMIGHIDGTKREALRPILDTYFTVSDADLEQLLGVWQVVMQTCNIPCSPRLIRRILHIARSLRAG